MAPESGQLWVEIVGGIIIARLRGSITQDLIRECQRRIVELQRDTDCTRVLYDALEMDRPPMGTVLEQQELSDVFTQAPIRVAIVVPNTGLAYLSRIAFAETDHRIFYNDLAAAVKWLAGK